MLLVYLGATVGLGSWFVVRSRTSERFMAAGRSLPGWAVGLSIYGSYVSSISFLANPGKAYAENWNPLVFALSLPLATWLAVRYFVPFYRRGAEVSAYHHLEHRFGPWARTYAVVCYLLMQVARLGTIMYLLALALQPLLGLEIKTLIVGIGILITIYPLLGGTEGVIWAGVAQSLIMTSGPLVCLALILFGLPQGPAQVFSVALEHHKFSLGSLSPSLTGPTVWVVLMYGLTTNLQNFGIDQSYVQRYLTAKSDRDAAKSVWMGGWFYIPISALFLLIGTALFAFYQTQPQLLPAGTKADAVFPHFIATQLPPGVTGLLIAAIAAAAMDSNLNCCATLVLRDVYQRYLRPQASEREAMRVLHGTVLFFGAASTAAALAMISIKSALDTWWKLAGIASGGMLGLFLLGRLSRRAGNRAAQAGVASGVLVILWMTFSPKWQGPLLPFKSPFHDFMTIVFGTLAILIVGLAARLLQRKKEGSGLHISH